MGASYGAKLQDLRYVIPSASTRSLACSYPVLCFSISDQTAPSASGLPQRTLVIHGTLTVLIPYLHNRLRIHALSHAWPDAPSNDRRRKAWDVLVRMESAYMACGLLSFVAFLWDGRCVVCFFSQRCSTYLVYTCKIPDHCGQASPYEPRTFTQTRKARRQLRIYEPSDGLACVYCRFLSQSHWPIADPISLPGISSLSFAPRQCTVNPPTLLSYNISHQCIHQHRFNCTIYPRSFGHG